MWLKYKLTTNESVMPQFFWIYINGIYIHHPLKVFLNVGIDFSMSWVGQTMWNSLFVQSHTMDWIIRWNHSNSSFPLLLKSYVSFTLWEKGVFCNWPYNSLFELQETLVNHYIYILWVLIDKLHELQSCNSPYIQCNSIAIQSK